MASTKKSKKKLENAELRPYDILPDYNKRITLLLLKAAQDAGASINNTTLKNIEDYFMNGEEEE